MPNLLKRLELNGFKSFAQKTVLEFPTGITAIVGPNGSGKSNVIDAIRWLLGEREAKNLRGAKAEDLIFAGTPKKARLGQAHASLHFENEKNFFPLEFAEISVSRQVDRDGSNKFFLNKAEIRLKDLIDFFAKVRLGTKGLVVITQGNSDIFVQASPAGRREMLEEMLGLREYQLKKNSSERRLKNTEINLEKVDALIKEILPHLRSLKRQTGRWEKREALADELHNLENQFFGHQWRELGDKISGIEKEIGVHREELKIFEKEKDAADEYLKKVEASRPAEREEMAGIKKELNEVLEKRSQFQKELGRLEARLEIYQKKPGDVSVPATKLVEFIEKARTRLEKTLDAEIESLRDVIRELMREIDVLFSAGEKEDMALPQDLKSGLAELEKNLAGLDGEISALRLKEETLGKNQEDFYRLFKKAAAGIEAAKDKIEKWENKNQERLFEKERLELRLSELKRQIEQAGRKPEEFNKVMHSEIPQSESFSSFEKRIFKLRGDLAGIGEVDEALLKEARETEERHNFLERQFEDLGKAKNDLRQLIEELSDKIRNEFMEALGKINEEFDTFFRLMFDGGRAKLKIVGQGSSIKGQVKAKGAEENKESNVAAEEEAEKEEKEVEEGIEISVNLPRKKIHSLETLSGGERSLVGIAALFALISVSPPPFLVLDEVDAALDSRNSRRFGEMLKEFSKKTQFIVVTHNRAVMETANVLYGVTLNEDGTSKILSLKLE
ncbi:MAG: AAA family ATPase [Candidatus Liptonbacteria bacterium]|nr:AAA family ATPase [Candidatus Liptonbacteria bacterium]